MDFLLRRSAALWSEKHLGRRSGADSIEEVIWVYLRLTVLEQISCELYWPNLKSSDRTIIWSSADSTADCKVSRLHMFVTFPSIPFNPILEVESRDACDIIDYQGLTRKWCTADQIPVEMFSSFIYSWQSWTSEVIPTNEKQVISVENVSRSRATIQLFTVPKYLPWTPGGRKPGEY